MSDLTRAAQICSKVEDLEFWFLRSSQNQIFQKLLKRKEKTFCYLFEVEEDACCEEDDNGNEYYVDYEFEIQKCDEGIFIYERNDRTDAYYHIFGYINNIIFYVDESCEIRDMEYLRTELSRFKGMCIV